MLTGIEIENFRGIRKGKVDGFGAVNVVVGPNGSGKSSLLEAIFLGAAESNQAMIGGESVRSVLTERHNERNFPSVDMHYGKDGERVIEVIYDFEGNTAPLSVTKSDIGWKPNGIQDGLRRWFAASKFLDIRLLLDTAVEQALWDAVLAIRADRDIVKTLNEVYKLSIEGLSYSKHSDVLKVLFSNRNYSLNVDDLGAGMRIALRVLMLAMLMNDGALIIEELDAYQHVDSMPEFTRALVAMARENSTQLFLATHSEETIGGFVEAAKDEGVGFRLIQTSLSADGVLETASFDAIQTSDLHDAGVDVRQGG
jgi:AAA15 family ATPase/GTPase